MQLITHEVWQIRKELLLLPGLEQIWAAYDIARKAYAQTPHIASTVATKNDLASFVSARDFQRKINLWEDCLVVAEQHCALALSKAEASLIKAMTAQTDQAEKVMDHIIWDASMQFDKVQDRVEDVDLRTLRTEAC